jgi:uncharacterized protein (TIGR00297 family)
LARLRSELLRKLVHIGMGGFALTLCWLGPWWGALCAVAGVLFNLLILNGLTRRMLLREAERQRGFSLGIALYPAAVLMMVLIFPHRIELAAAAWGLLAFGDGMATVAGLGVGGPRLPWNQEKRWSGFIAFVLFGTASAAFLIRWSQRNAFEWIGDSFLSVEGQGNQLFFLLTACLIAALAAAFAESLRTGIDDNLLVPLVGGMVLYGAALVEPGVLAAAGELIQTQLIWGALINALLAAAAFAARGVGLSGAVWGWVLGTALFACGGWQAFLMLVLFFGLGTATTKLGYARKAALGIAQEKGGRRGASNAFANTTTGVVFAFLALATASPELFLVAMTAAFATATCDTVSSEVGQAYGRHHYLVTTFKPVPAGTDGAVSLEGTLAGIGGAMVLAVAAWAIGMISPGGAAVVVTAAFIGATVESYLGATFEQAKLIDNELVNFTNTVIGGLTACALFVWFLR